VPLALPVSLLMQLDAFGGKQANAERCCCLGLKQANAACFRGAFSGLGDGASLAGRLFGATAGGVGLSGQA
jgi:hypothetical protein